MLYPYISEQISPDEFWLVIHIFIRTDGAGEFSLFGATLGKVILLWNFPSSLLCIWDGWAEVEEDDNWVTQSSGLLLLHILLFLSFREIQEPSEGEPLSRPIMKKKKRFAVLPAKNKIQCARN